MDRATGPGDQRDRSRLYRTEAVVLRRRDLGEADRILTIFTESRGKLRVVAKGVRRTKSRLAGHLEPFSRAHLQLAQGRNLDIVTQASTVDPMRRLREVEDRIAYAGYLADLLDALTAEGQHVPRSYQLLLVALRRLDAGVSPYVTVRFFELTLLDLLGFSPELHKCIACGTMLEPVVNAFSVEGGLLCLSCGERNALASPISLNALKVMRLLGRGDLDRADALSMSDELCHEVERLLTGYIRHVLGRELPSLAVLKTISR